MKQRFVTFFWGIFKHVNHFFVTLFSILYITLSPLENPNTLLDKFVYQIPHFGNPKCPTTNVFTLKKTWHLSRLFEEQKKKFKKLISRLVCHNIHFDFPLKKEGKPAAIFKDLFFSLLWVTVKLFNDDIKYKDDRSCVSLC